MTALLTVLMLATLLFTPGNIVVLLALLAVLLRFSCFTSRGFPP